MTKLDEPQPAILRKDGKEQFAVLPWEQYLALREMVEDAQDVLLIRQTRQESSSEPHASIEEVMKRFDMTPGEKK